MTHHFISTWSDLRLTKLSVDNAAYLAAELVD